MRSFLVDKAILRDGTADDPHLRRLLHRLRNAVLRNVGNDINNPIDVDGVEDRMNLEIPTLKLSKEQLRNGFLIALRN
jgi:hypothetical protein